MQYAPATAVKIATAISRIFAALSNSLTRSLAIAFTFGLFALMKFLQNRYQPLLLATAARAAA
jgi:hypothetical protein